MAETRRGLRAWSKALERAEGRAPDATLMLALAELRDVLGSVEVLAMDARHGRYDGQGQERPLQ